MWTPMTKIIALPIIPHGSAAFCLQQIDRQELHCKHKPAWLQEKRMGKFSARDETS